MLESATVNRLLCMLMLCAAACVAPNAQPRTSDADEGELVKAPPAAVKLAAAKGLPDPNEVICSFERDTGTNIPGWGDFTVLPQRQSKVLAVRYDWRDNSVACLHNLAD